MFDQKEREIIVKTMVKPGLQGWNGVLPYTTVLRTCGLEIPRGHASINCRMSGSIVSRVALTRL